MNMLDMTLDEAIERKEILMFGQGSYTCHQVTKQKSSTAPRRILQSGMPSDRDFFTSHSYHHPVFQDVFMSLALSCTTLTEGSP